MKYTNILEKLLCLFNIVKTSYIDIIFLLVVVISLILLFRKKISSRVCYIINVISSLVLLGVVIYNNIDKLSSTIDSIVDFTFTNIYFPSIYVYLIVLIVTNVFCILSLLRKRMEKKYKIINGSVMLVINFILAIILDIVASDSVDLFKKESMFANTNLVMMMELSVNIFLVWCAINLIMYVADCIADRILITRNAKVLNKGAVNMNVLTETINTESLEEEYTDVSVPREEVKNKFIPVNTVSVDNYVDVNENKFIPNVNMINNNMMDNGFDLSSLIPKKNELKTIVDMNSIDYVSNTNVVLEDNVNYLGNASMLTNTNEIFNSIINNDLPFIIKEEKNEKDTYTLNDYRIFNKILKDIKEHNDGSRISIDKNLEYRLITKYSVETYDMFKRMLKNYSN